MGEAESCYQEAIDFLGKLIERMPSNEALRLDRATAIEALAMIALERGGREEPRKRFSTKRSPTCGS